MCWLRLVEACSPTPSGDTPAPKDTRESGGNTPVFIATDGAAWAAPLPALSSELTRLEVQRDDWAKTAEQAANKSAQREIQFRFMRLISSKLGVRKHPVA